MDAIILSSAISIDNKLLVVSKDDGMREFAKEHSCPVFNDVTSMLERRHLGFQGFIAL